jgi:SSS family solute:Na+ symporter
MGGLVTCYLALTLVSEKFGYGGDILKGLSVIKEKAPSHFHMIFDRSNPYYKDLPGLSVLIGGMWINNLNYWGCNQYITQRALGADLYTARKGILFAAFLKLLIPLIVVIPGITMFVMYQQGMFQQEMTDINGILKPDHSYPTLMNLLPNGLKGLAFAALTAAIVASLAGKANSISTIFSLDIYKKFFNKNATEKRLVLTGRITVIVAMILAGLVAPALRNLDQAYQFIQEYVGFISPGVLSIFLLGFFWKRTTSTAALTSAILTIPLSTALKFLPVWTNGAFPDFPFMDRMTLVFIILMLLIIVMSLADRKSKNNPKALTIDSKMFRCSPGFVVGSTIILGILAALYTVFY